MHLIVMLLSVRASHIKKYASIYSNTLLVYLFNCQNKSVLSLYTGKCRKLLLQAETIRNIPVSLFTGFLSIYLATMILITGETQMWTAKRRTIRSSERKGRNYLSLSKSCCSASRYYGYIC